MRKLKLLQPSQWRLNALPITLVTILLLIGGLGFAWLIHSQQIQTLIIATASKDGEYYAFARDLAKITARHQVNLRLQVLETKGSAENMQLLQAGKVQLAIAQSDIPFEPKVQTVAVLFPEVFHLLTAPSAQIRSIPDLEGKKIALLGSGSYRFFQQLIAHYGIAKSGVQTIPLTFPEAEARFREGKVAGLFRSIALGNPKMRDLIEATQAHLVPIDQVGALQIMQPFLQPVIIPKGLYGGNPPLPAQDTPAASVRALLLTHKDADPDLIYQVVQILHDYRNELATLNPRAASISPATDIENLGLPLNPGAANYYNKSQPSFLERYSESIALIITVGGILLSFLWQLRNRWQRRQKNRGDAYNLEILDLVEEVAHCQNLQELEAIRRQLFTTFKCVVQDLDQDKISFETFQAFAISWEVTINTIRHQEILLRSQAELSEKRGSLPM